MFLTLSKLMTPLISPLGISFLLWLAALVLYRLRRGQWARRCGLAGIGVVLFFSNPMIADALLGSLENDFATRPIEDYPRADIIVVLGGVTGASLPPRQSVEAMSGIDRLIDAVRLLRAAKARAIMVSGGSSYGRGPGVTEAEHLRDLALDFGVRERQVLLEMESLNTFQNAKFVRQRLEQMGLGRILLVTSASHMWRAVGCFRKQGLAVIPVPADIEVVPRRFDLLRFLPHSEAMNFSSRAIKEYVGYFVYWLRGWI